jgi:predicted transcriptional regulator
MPADSRLESCAKGAYRGGGSLLSSHTLVLSRWIDGRTRPDLYIVARILERLWREDKPMLKTRLQTASNVNYDVFKRYASWMADRGLIAVESSDDRHERLSLTPKGGEAYRKLVQWINEVIHEKMPS